MSKLHMSLYSFLLISLFSCKKETSPPAPVLPVPDMDQLAWQKMETNAFIHFSINTFTNKEWGYGDESPEVFDPVDLNAEQWITTLKDAGFKGVILTCKHHDGFCLWPTAYTDFSVKNSPWKDGKGNVVKEVADACRKYGLKFGIYLSPWDRHQATYGTPAYIEYYRNQLKELFTQFSPIYEMWFDGANGGDGYYGGAREKRTIDGKTYYHWPETLEMITKLDSGVLFFSDAGPDIRWCGNEQGYAGTTNWNTISTDSLYPGKPAINDLLNTGSPDGDKWVPAEVDVSIRPGWFYHPSEDSLVKTPEELFTIYLNSVGHGSTLLLNVPPDPSGRIHQTDADALSGWKKLMDKTFATDLASGMQVVASEMRGGAKEARYAPNNITDGNYDTYWATDDGIDTGHFDIHFHQPLTVRYIILQEYIPLGQRVKSFTIEASVDGEWKKIAEGTTIGYKRIIKTEPVNTDQIRVNITGSKACPVISNTEVY